MRPGAHQVELVRRDLINQQPVWLDVAVPVMVPVVTERMIL
jgi:hypothetical protein